MKIARSKKETLLFSILLIVFFIMQLNRLKIGFPSTDEQLYIVFPYRLINGDLLFVDEWNGAQLIGFITLPILKLYLFINSNSLEGVVYFFRLCYLILMTLTTITIFYLSKKNIVVGLSLIIYYLSCPFNIMSLSYNTLSVMLVLVTLFMLYRFSNRFTYFLSGVFFSLSVLCIPYLAIVYFILLLIVIVLAIKRNTKYLNLFIMFSLGILIMAALFITTMIKGNISSVFQGISIILNDPSHQGNLIKSIVDYFYQFARFTNFFLLVWIILMIRMFKTDNKSKYLKLAILNCGIYVVFCFILYNLNAYRYLFMNVTFMISLLGITGYYANESKDKKLFVIYMLSFMISFILNIQSNVGTQPITTGLIVTNVFSLFLLSMCSDSKIISKYFVILSIMIICYLVYFKSYIYDYPKNYNANVIVKDGLYKGIRVNDNELADIKEWDNESEKINSLIKNSKDRILLLDSSPLKYLKLNARIGTFSTYVYLSDNETRNNLYMSYINLNRETLKYIYLPKKNALNVPDLNDVLENDCESINSDSFGTLYYCDIEQ